MVNENKVKIMTKMAMYEHNEGTEDIAVSTYYKKDYMSLKVLISLIWVTFGYIVALLVFGVSCRRDYGTFEYWISYSVSGWSDSRILRIAAGIWNRCVSFLSREIYCGKKAR